MNQYKRQPIDKTDNKDLMNKFPHLFPDSEQCAAVSQPPAKFMQKLAQLTSQQKLCSKTDTILGNKIYVKLFFLNLWHFLKKWKQLQI